MIVSLYFGGIWWNGDFKHSFLGKIVQFLIKNLLFCVTVRHQNRYQSIISTSDSNKTSVNSHDESLLVRILIK